MIEYADNPTTTSSRIKPLLLVALTAFVMGLPTVRGGFVGGDDHRLALDHVLVNHPSWEHAVELFAITHRDLYQPLPLLSFSAEFLVCDAIGLTRGGPERFAWLFHLDNVWLHAINALLVWWTIAMLHGRIRRKRSPNDKERGATREAKLVATIAAVVFAVHPFNTEVVAWVNGRMMLLSNMFGLLALLAWHAWLDRANRGRATSASQQSNGYWLVPVILLATLCCAVSKIRIGLPVLMLIVAWTGGDRLRSRRLLPVWIVCAAITAVFVVVNVRATAAADLFAGGAEHLHGPRIIRVMSALAFYFAHYVYPVGLASYYPTPPTVSWSDATTWHAVLVVVPVLIVLAWASWRSRVWRYGVLWFFATLSATLPFMPARNVLAADRYMYLPIIGLLWPTAATLLWLWQKVVLQTRGWIRRGLVPAAVVVVVLAMIGQCWNIEWYYETPLKKTMRVAYLFPDVPRVWERLGWSYYEQGAYDKAVELAKKELHHDAPNVKSGAYQLIGMSLFKRGDTKNALSYLHQAIDVDPDNALGMYRLATVYDDIGDYETALPYFEKAVKAAPLHNPTLHRLAGVYRKLNRRADARRTYAREIQNNAFEIPAYVALAEMDLEDGDDGALRHARKELTTILKLVPDSTTARITLGVVWARMGRTRKAIDAYTRVLASNPNDPTALVNLAELYNNTGDTDRAAALFGRASSLPLTIEQAQAVSDFFVARGEWARAAAVWNARAAQAPDTSETRARLGWIYAMQGDLARARATLPDPGSDNPNQPLTLSLRAFIALRTGHYKDALKHVKRLNTSVPRAKEARRRLLGALEQFDRVSPGNPWTFCMAARLLIADGQPDAARTSVGLCRSRCADEPCRQEAALIDAELKRLDNPN